MPERQRVRGAADGASLMIASMVLSGVRGGMSWEAAGSVFGVAALLAGVADSQQATPASGNRQGGRGRPGGLGAGAEHLRRDG